MKALAALGITCGVIGLALAAKDSDWLLLSVNALNLFALTWSIQK